MFSGLSWDELCALAAHIPNIKEIYISGSTLLIQNTPHHIFQQLSILDLQNSGIDDWERLSDLDALPNLDTLILSNNSISKISLRPGQFPSLHTLSLDNNKVGEWESVACLRNLPLLSTLRMRENPLVAGPALDMRLLVIAVVPAASKLNATPITVTERLQADIF